MTLEKFMAEHLPAIERELDQCLPPDDAYPEKAASGNAVQHPWRRKAAAGGFGSGIGGGGS